MRTDLWQRGCERLASELPDQQFNTWIRPLPDADVNDEAETAVVTVRVPNRFKLDWIRNQYAGRIETVLSELAGKPVRLDVTLAPQDGVARSNPVAGHAASVRAFAIDAARPNGHASGSSALSASSGPTAPPGPRASAAAAAQLSSQAPLPSRSRLNTALTFDTLVPGRANQMARTAALYVAGAPGQMYNPLFIYGGVGLGKTHLIHAVGNALLADRPDARILYLHAEQFITDVVSNYQRKTFDELKLKYHALDLLLIDDVQFLAGKERTQEEFYNAFEALLAKRAHIIMTSDIYPKGLVNIDERLTSRFDAGLTVAIEPPELEMRVAILMRKADQEGTAMPEDVAFFVAKNVRANVRELEGALRKILAYSRFSQKDINIQLAREALKDLLSIQNRQVGVENIRRRSPTSTRSRWPTCTRRSVLPRSPGRGRSRCTSPRR
jgi:chromosomal replication initiator protein